MRKLQICKWSLVFFVLSMIMLVQTTDAHPGRTDANGGHTCRTNCEKWGLSYGEYHYHNGGKTSSKPTATSINKEKEQQEKEQQEKEQKEKEQQEKKDGEIEGYSQGDKDGYLGTLYNPMPRNSSSIYIEAYKLGYEKGYEEGKNKLEQETSKAKELGTKLGETQDEPSIPSQYEEHSLLKKAFQDAFEKSVEERDARKEKEFELLGYEDGKIDVAQEPENLKPSYSEAYRRGYEKGLEELKIKYFNLGYEAAFTVITYENPNFGKEMYVQWYREGFESNKDIEKIQQISFDLGRNGNEYVIPDEYQIAEPVFKHYYLLGQKQRKEDTRSSIMGGTILVGGWLARRAYIARKMIK